MYAPVCESLIHTYNTPMPHTPPGNRDTLFVRPRASGADPRQAVVSFHEHHYCASRSKLVVLGRQGLDELEGMVGASDGSVLAVCVTAGWGAGNDELDELEETAGARWGCVPY